ncbi:MAG: acyl-ACP--UDP-N-acetylglucosamine O-acyltransferase [Pseudomonadota bacterium]
MANIHPTAIIESGAEIGNDVTIGPYCVVGSHVHLGDEVQLHSHVVIEGDTKIGKGTEIFPFASIGHIPQDKKFQGENSKLEIGEHNIIREHVTMNPGTSGGTLVTKVGSHGLFMMGSHVAHDCEVGDHVILANNATLAGHCKIGDSVILGGLSAVHQFVRIGSYAFVGGMSGVENDVIPYGMVVGDRAYLNGLNIIGLKRKGFDREQIHSLRKGYRMLFATEGTLIERLEDVEKMFSDDVCVEQISTFIRTESGRSLCVPKNGEAS